MRYLSAVIPILLAAFLSTAHAADDEITGVFSNEEEGFKIVTLMIHKDGLGYLHVAVAGQIGEWKFDKGESVLSFTVFDDSAGKDETVRLKFDSQHSSYILMRPDKSVDTTAERTLHFITNQIPDKLVQAFKEYPEKIKEVRRGVLARKEAAKRWQEQLERERPEYERILSRIKDDPKTVLSKEFYTRDVTPATRAFQASLSDKETKFPEEVLVALLEQLPDDNHWIRVLVFARPELSASTLERFYPKALVWGKLNYTILANIATHSNTPIAIVRDLAGRGELPVGATIPAKQRLKKLDAKSQAH